MFIFLIVLCFVALGYRFDKQRINDTKKQLCKSIDIFQSYRNQIFITIQPLSITLIMSITQWQVLVLSE